MTADRAGLVCYKVNARVPIRCSHAGVRRPIVDYHQRRRVRDDFVAFLVTKGEIFLMEELPGGLEHFRVGPGEVHVCGPGIYQSSTQPFAPGTEFLWFHFMISDEPQLLSVEESESCVQMLYNSANRNQPTDFWLIPRQLDYLTKLTEVVNVHKQLVDNKNLWSFNDPGSDILCAYLASELHREYLTRSLQFMGRGGRNTKSSHVNRALNFIQLNYDQAISLEDVANALNLNAAYLSRCFQKKAGMTIGQAIHQVKVSKAKEMLAEKQYSVKEVAYLTGFGSASYFCRIFYRLTGTTPTKFVETV